MSKPKLSIPFRLIDIEENQFSVFEEELDVDAPIQEEIRVGFGVDPDNCVISSRVLYFLRKEDRPFIKMELTCYFEVDQNDFDQKLRKNDKVILPLDFARHLGVLTSGTLRGALFAKTQNSPFNQYRMRLINLDKVIKADVSIDLEE